ncbi:autotransporter outer membrane beta-barrel domain-containing protein [Alienimonas californiensis]|uniref:autotransporter outer membrane beta-barrel domain-containing protein n=1 Tax=Alienimonas californiensis TaxID=2527989 RepID=UPI0011A233C9|nr:autotransporter outer membrane beta-barrel domain-containing protein [Alienimonas californiensis]
MTTETPPDNDVILNPPNPPIDLPFFATVEDVQVNGSLSVGTNTGWVKAEDLLNFGNVTVGTDALITTQTGGTLLPGNVQYANRAGATTNVFGRLIVGGPVFSGAAADNPPPATAIGSGILEVTGGSVNALGAGQIRAGELNVTGGLFNTSGFGANSTISGSTVINGAGAELRVSNGGVTNVDSLTQTAGLVDARAGGTLTVAGPVDPLDPTDISGRADFNDRLRVSGTLNAATTFLRAGSLLNGRGTINSDVFASGRIAPGQGLGAGANGMGVLNIGGDYVGDSVVYDIEVTSGGAGNAVAGLDYDQIAVAGQATINGGTVNVILPAGADASSFSIGRRYDFITAAGGLVVNAPVVVVNPQPDVRLILDDGPNRYSLVVGRNVPLASFADTYNVTAVSVALDQVSTDPALARLFNAVDTQPTEALARQAINGLSGEVYGTQMTALNRNSLQFLDIIAGQDAAAPLVCGTCGVNRDGEGAWQGWNHTYAAGGRVTGDGNAFPAEMDNAGMVIGATRIFGRSNACLAVSGFFGSEISTVEVNTERVGGSKSVVNDEVHRLGTYLRGSVGRVHGRLTGVVGAADAESRRVYELSDSQGGLPFADVAGAEYETILGAVDSEVGYLFGAPTSFIMPVAGLRYVEADRDEFTEVGGLTALDVSDTFLKEVRARAGLRTGNQLSFITIAPTSFTMEAFYSRDVSAASVADYDARLSAAPAASFNARGTDFGDHRFVLGPGLSVGIGPVQFSARYRASLTESSTVHSGNANFEVCF